MNIQIHEFKMLNIHKKNSYQILIYADFCYYKTTIQCESSQLNHNKGTMTMTMATSERQKISISEMCGLKIMCNIYTCKLQSYPCLPIVLFTRMQKKIFLLLLLFLQNHSVRALEWNHHFTAAGAITTTKCLRNFLRNFLMRHENKLKNGNFRKFCQHCRAVIILL